MQIIGTIKVILPEVQVTEKFTKREFVITTEGNYPQDIIMQASKTLALNQFTEGEKVEVSINIKGREHNGKYYTSIEAWGIKSIN
jgi:hypothetical protein